MFRRAALRLASPPVSSYLLSAGRSGFCFRIVPKAGARQRPFHRLPMGDRSDSITVEQSLPLERLDVFLKSQLPQVSRGVLQSMIEDGAILVDGKKVKPTYSPRAGETILIHWPEPIAPRAEPEEMDLDVLYEDDQIIAINKPAGLVVHPAAGHHGGTLVNALLHHCKGQLSGIAGVARPGIVHRLD